MLSLLGSIFKACEDLISFHVFLSYVPIVQVEEELA